jgi:hypothetical protein
LAAGCNTTQTPNNFDAGDAGRCGDGDGGTPPAAQACNDLVDALARAKVRCEADAGTTYDSAFTAVLAQVASGDCNTVSSIRDEASLCANCVPSLSTIACADIADNRLPGSCNLQLERSQP